ncbi:MAG: transposase [bacterium]|nr:transposase [bacterium]
MELYHVLNRGVDKRNIFLDDRDRARFVHDMYEFNDTSFANNVGHFFLNKDLRSPYAEKRRAEKTEIVDIHGWCIMRNHYHLLLSERVDGGLTRFIRKLNIGYAKYFNERYIRVGALFQGRTKKVLIANDAHFLHILHYIHLNPLDYLKGSDNWRRLEVTNARGALAYLGKYRWSSYLDYCGMDNFPSIITTDLFGDIFKDYKKTLTEYVHSAETEVIHNTPLE